VIAGLWTYGTGDFSSFAIVVFFTFLLTSSPIIGAIFLRRKKGLLAIAAMTPAMTIYLIASISVIYS